jgi:1-acyl-sn-glycerol-3-phosphate acyltransferase
MNLRFVLFVVTYLSVGIVLNIFYLLLFPFAVVSDPHRKRFIKLFYLYHHFVSSIFWTTEVSGHPIYKCRKPSVFILNHQSILDSFPIYLMSPHTCKLVIASGFKLIPVIGTITIFVKMLFVKRSNKNSKESVLTQSVKCLNSGISLMLAPEGKLSYSSELKPFKLGGFQAAHAAGVPIVPVRNESRLLFDQSSRLKLLPGKLRLHIFEPIESKGRSPEELRDLAYQKINSISLG